MSQNLKRIIVLNILLLVISNTLFFIYLKSINYTPKIRYFAHILFQSKDNFAGNNKDVLSSYKKYLLNNFSTKIQKLSITSELLSEPFFYKKHWSAQISYDLRYDQNGNLHLKKILEFLNSEIKNFTKIRFQELDMLYSEIENKNKFKNIINEKKIEDINIEYFKSYDFLIFFSSIIKMQAIHGLDYKQISGFGDLIRNASSEDFYYFNEKQYNLDNRRLNPTFINLMIFLSLIVISFTNIFLFCIKGYKKFF